jgi:hypothetical protein
VTFQENLTADLAVLLNTDEFAESVTYTPSGGSAKTINALVDRNPMRMLEAAAMGFQQAGLEIYIANDATLGVTSVKEGLDTVTLKLRQGDSSTTVLIVKKVVESDLQMFRLECGQ